MRRVILQDGFSQTAKLKEQAAYEPDSNVF